MKKFAFLFFILTLTLSAQDYSLGVIYFETAPGGTNLLEEDDKRALSMALTEMTIADLSFLQILTLVDRENLNKVIEEQQLALSGLLDESTTAQAGELLGARYLMTGSLVFTGQITTFSTRITDVESGAILASAVSTGAIEEVFTLQEQAIEELITQWDIPLSRREWELLARRDNLSLRGLISFGNALEASDNGDYEGALSYLQAAVDISPDFELARSLIRMIEERFDRLIQARENDLPLEILDRIDDLAAGDEIAEQDVLKMYWAYMQPLMMGMSYYGSWATMPRGSRGDFFNTIKSYWPQMGLTEEPESMEFIEDYLGRKLFIAHSILEYLLEKDLPQEGFNPYMHPVEGMMGYFLTAFAAISSAPDWKFPPMVNAQGEVVVEMEQYYHILLRYCDMFMNNFPYSAYNATITPMMAVLLEKTGD